MASAPLSEFVCKIASRCNLDCDYCYVYHHIDQSWRSQPKRMTLATAAQLGKRINEHAVAHNLPAVNVILHGGEPFLLPPTYLRQLCRQIRANAADVQVHFHVQTNGTLFDQRALDVCLEDQIAIGLSFDGPRAVNDRHRRDLQGESSFDAVERALGLLTSPAGRTLWSGFLAVIDLHNDPLEVYSYLASFHPTTIEFLFPLAHYDARPPGKEDTLTTTPYADWLLEIFRTWYSTRPQPIKVRRFRDIIALMAGVLSATEEWGVPVDLIVVESNGEIQAVDTLKVTYPGANHLGLTIFDHSFDDALRSPLVIERQIGRTSLCPTCQRCPVVSVCGGGYFPHRYSREKGFQNPSVYCADLMKLIREIHATVSADVQAVRAKSREETA
jgi:uncharacterized protein